MALVTKKTWAWVVVIFLVSLALYHINAKQTQAAYDGQQAHDYLCYQKLVVIPGRIKSTLDYEVQVQLGERTPIKGLTPADLATSIKRDQASLRALNRVKCK